jgi:hypothetical protein
MHTIYTIYTLLFQLNVHKVHATPSFASFAGLLPNISYSNVIQLFYLLVINAVLFQLLLWAQLHFVQLPSETNDSNFN